MDTSVPASRFRGQIIEFAAVESAHLGAATTMHQRPAKPARAASISLELPPRYSEHGSPDVKDTSMFEGKPSLYRPGHQILPSPTTASASTSPQLGHKSLSTSNGDQWNYFLYTRKGRRGLYNKARLFSYKVLIPFALFVFGLLKIFVFPSKPEHTVNGDIAKHAHEAVFLNSWIDHVITHPIRARDKAGFAEMGLRTEMYAHLLKYPTLPDFDRMERVLWPFVPGINQLRRWWVDSSHLTNVPGQNKGIVMSLGYKGSVFASQFISIIRDKHQNDIPIELYYYGDKDLPQKYRDYLTTTFRNVRCIDLESLGLFDADLVQLERQGFAIKPFALLATNFTEVMLADADAILLEDPDNFFQEPGYLDTGTLFFHDRDHVRHGADGIIREFMDNQLAQRGPSPRLAQSEFWKKRGIFEQESGIVVVDKRRINVFAALLFTAWQNMGEIRKKTTYRVWWGDKETFWLAFEFSNFPYYFVPKYAQAIGTVGRHSTIGKDGKESKVDSEELCSEHPLHFLGADTDDNNGDGVAEQTTLGRPAWFNGGILDVKVLSDEIYIDPNTFSVDGEWEFLFEEEKWCIRNYTKGNMQAFDLSPRINEIKDIAKKAEDRFRAKIPKVKSVKEAVLANN